MSKVALNLPQDAVSGLKVQTLHVLAPEISKLASLKGNGQSQAHLRSSNVPPFVQLSWDNLQVDFSHLHVVMFSLASPLQSSWVIGQGPGDAAGIAFPAEYA
jgi:hypothetical protein